MVRPVCLALISACLVAPVSAFQQEERLARGRALLARVVNGGGRAEVDLGIDDFVDSEAGEDLEVLDVHVADYPVALLLDDTTPPRVLEAMKAAAERFIVRVGERPVAVSTLSRPDAPVAGFLESRSGVLRALAGIARSTNPVRPLPALALLSGLIVETGASFSAVIVLAGGAVDVSREVNGQPLAEFLGSGATVHVVGHVEARVDRPEKPPSDLFKWLTTQTNGQYTTI